MKTITILIICLSLFLTSIAQVKAVPVALPADLPTYSKVYDEQRDPFKDAAAALALAQKSNRQVLLEIGGNWCGWCHKIDTFLANNPDIFQALHSQYVLLKINVSDSNENSDFMKSLPPVLGYPHMYVSTAQGKMLLSKDTAELLDENNYSKKYWLRFLNQWSVNATAAKQITTTLALVE